MEPEIHEADPAQRRRLVKWLVVIAICGGVLLLLAEPLAQRVAIWAAADPGAEASRAGLLLAAIGLATVLPVLGLVIYLFRLARAVIEAERYPPPNMPVAIATPVLKGERAVARGRMIRFLAGTLVIVTLAEIYLLVAVWQSIAASGTTVAAVL